MASITTTAPPERAEHDDAPHGHSRQYRPLGSYALLTGAFNAAFAGALFAGRRRLPERYSAGDVALLSVATYKLSRVIAKGRVTSGLRAPFTEFQGDAGPSEVDERARGRGLRRAVGELLVCPYCLEQWAAAGFVAGLAWSPRATRAVATTFAVAAAADLLQLGRLRLHERP